jgi:hypothetical protein
MNELKDPTIQVPNEKYDERQHAQFESHSPHGIVDVLGDAHGQIDHEKEVRVQKANVVENVCRSLCQTQKDDEKVQSPDHLQDSDRTVVRLEVKEGEITKASHPDVTGNHDSDRIVDFRGVVVMVQKEHELHPSFPFLRLISIQYFSRIIHRGDELLVGGFFLGVRISSVTRLIRSRSRRHDVTLERKSRRHQ